MKENMLKIIHPRYHNRLPRFSREPLNTSRLSLQLTWRKLIQPSTPMTLSANWTCPTMGECGMVGAYLRLVSWWQFWVWSSWRATVPLRKISGNSWIWCEYMLGENTSSTESPGSSSPKTLWRWSTWSTARLPTAILHVRSSCGAHEPMLKPAKWKSWNFWQKSMIRSPVPSHHNMKKLCKMRRRELEPQFQPGLAPPGMFHGHVQQLLPPLLKTKT